MRQFVGGVQRIDIHHTETGAQNRGNRHDVLQTVGHHHRHAVALLQAALLQPCADLFRIIFDLGVAQGFFHAHRERALGIAGKRVLVDGGDGGELMNIDFSRNIAVLTEPRFVHKVCSCVDILWIFICAMHQIFSI